MHVCMSADVYIHVYVYVKYICVYIYRYMIVDELLI